VNLYFERGSTGPNVLFFNGSGATLEESAPLIDAIREFACVVAHDQRGLGKTGIIDGPYTMAQYARDGAALLDHVGWRTCNVIGISFGGMVAQELAVTWPERVEKLVLLCTSAGGEAGSSYPLHELATKTPVERIAIGRLRYDTRFTDAFLAGNPFHRAIAEMLADRQRTPKSDLQRRGEALQLEARRGHDVADRLGWIRCPTLVMAGRFDGIAPAANSEAIAQRIPNARLRLYDGGHLFVLQDRRALLDIREFVTT
jgi:pimeloyl-ACP methyl ester carboxylesterase